MESRFRPFLIRCCDQLQSARTGHTEQQIGEPPAHLMTVAKPPLDTQAAAPPLLVVRPRAERVARLAKMARPKLVARANEFFKTCDGSDATFNGYTETHSRFILAVRPTGRSSESFGISFVTCLYLAGPTFWSNAQLRCKAVEDSDGALLYEIADQAVGFTVRCDTIVVPAYGLTFAHEWSRQLAG